MGGCLSSKLLVVTTTTTSFRSLSFGSSSNHPPPPPFHHPPPHHDDQTTTTTTRTSSSTTENHMPAIIMTNASDPQRLIGSSSGPSSPDHHHHQIDDGSAHVIMTTSQEYLLLHKQLAGVNPESNEMVLVPPVLQSRSFHTIEEYDAIVNMQDDDHYLPSTHNYNYSQTLPPQVLPRSVDLPSKYSKSWSNISPEAPDDDQPSSSAGGGDDDDYSFISTNISDCMSSDKQVMRSSVALVVEEASNSSCKDGVLASERDHQLEDEEEGSIKSHQQGIRPGEIRGTKRTMIVAKRRLLVGSLQVLAVPPPLEFTTLSLRQWLPGGGSSEYATPKFGSYNNNINVVVGGGGEESSRAASMTMLVGQPILLMGSDQEEEEAGSGGGKVIIEPELVAAFEECMQQFEREEEKLIKQIEEGGI